MKRTFLALCAVLLVISMTTCNNVTAPLDTENEPPLFTEDGRPMVRLSIGVGNGSARALTHALAKGTIDYYEVAFKDQAPGSTTVYRTAWDYTKRGRLAVPAGNYNTAAKAVLFAGRYSDKTLLAIGVLTNVDAGTGTLASPVTNILTTTTQVTFTLVPLLNDISTRSKDDDGAAVPPKTFLASTFQITGPSNTGTIYPDAHNYTTAALGAAGKPIPSEKIFDTLYPIFAVPPKGYNPAADSTTPAEPITARYRVNCGEPDTVTGESSSQYGNFFDGVFFPASTPALPRMVYTAGNAYLEDYGTDVVATISAVTHTLGKNPVDISITIDVKDSPNNGLARLSVEVPAYPIDDLNTPGIWYIRGGLSQSLLDGGIDVNTIGSLGGAVLLAVGPVTINGIEIVPAWPAP